MKITVKVKGAKKAKRNMRVLESKTVTFADAFEDIGDYFRDQVDMQFSLRGALPGIRDQWRPLSPTTIRLRGGGNTPLIRHERLLKSYVQTTNPFNVNNITSMTARFGSGYRGFSNKGKLVPIAKFHQEGTKHMPARPVVLGNKQLDEEIVDSVIDHLFSGWIR